MADDPAAILRAARALIERPEAWARRRSALTANGATADMSMGDPAVCWCMVGAVWWTLGHAVITDDVWLPIERAIGTSAIATWNDAPHRTHAEVLDALDRAVALAEGGVG